ncbi:MAG: histidine kinase, partial [Pseudomonadota bacterium]
ALSHAKKGTQTSGTTSSAAGGTTKITLKNATGENFAGSKDFTISKKSNEDIVTIDGMLGGTRIKGDIAIGAPEKSSLEINGINISAPPGPPLPPALRDDIRRKVSSDVRRLGIGTALIVTFIPLFIMLMIAKLYIGRSRRALEVASVKTQEAEFANVNRQIVEAKLMALQAQVEPHFLYNTLANVQALTEVDPQQANLMTGHLIQYLRASLPKMRENISTVGQEVELVRAYLNILKMRMGSRLEFGIDVPRDLENISFPPLMLPSLVENAIKHGLEPQREGGRIDVVAEKIGDGEHATIRIMVKDSGKGLSDSPIQAGGGIGLSNIRERLLALFGDKAKLTLESNIPKGVVATIETPAAGAAAFTSAAALATQPTAPKTWSAKTLNVAARTHNAWAGILIKVFIGIVSILGVLFVVGMIGLATNMIPLTIGETRLSGIEGMAVGTVAFMLIFGILSIVALFLIAVIYGLGFLFVGLAIGVPVVILVSLFPVLAPFVAIGFLVYWFWWRKRDKRVTIDTTKA